MANGAARLWIESHIYAWHVERMHAFRQGLQLLVLLKFSQANSIRLVVISRIASSYHAAVKFRQYDYAGYFPNRTYKLSNTNMPILCAGHHHETMAVRVVNGISIFRSSSLCLSALWRCSYRYHFAIVHLCHMPSILKQRRQWVSFRGRRKRRKRGVTHVCHAGGVVHDFEG